MFFHTKIYIFNLSNHYSRKIKNLKWLLLNGIIETISLLLYSLGSNKFERDKIETNFIPQFGQEKGVCMSYHQA